MMNVFCSSIVCICESNSCLMRSCVLRLDRIKPSANFSSSGTTSVTSFADFALSISLARGFLSNCSLWSFASFSIYYLLFFRTNMWAMRDLSMTFYRDTSRFYFLRMYSAVILEGSGRVGRSNSGSKNFTLFKFAIFAVELSGINFICGRTKPLAEVCLFTMLREIGP